MIRTMLSSDKEAVLRLAQQFFEERLAQEGLEMDMDKSREQFDLYVNHPSFIALVQEHDGTVRGMIVATLGQKMFIRGKGCEEIVWYVEKGYRIAGVALIRELERRARDAGCEYISMVGLSGDKSQGFYKKFGYREIETQFYKRI